MNFSLWYAVLRRLGLILILGAVSSPSFAIPVMDMHVEDLLPMGPDFRQELKLTPNQLTLWQQIDAKSHQLARERRSRRDRLEAALKQRLAEPKVELRDLVAGLDAEMAASASEEKQLRAWWLEVNDALDETQRQAVVAFIAAQMQRVMDGGPQPAGERGDRGKSGSHIGRQKQGSGNMNSMNPPGN